MCHTCSHSTIHACVIFVQSTDLPPLSLFLFEFLAQSGAARSVHGEKEDRPNLQLVEISYK